jgi:hypothetical protein
MKNTLLNGKVLEEYIKNYKEQIEPLLPKSKEIIDRWKEKLSLEDNSKNLYKEVKNYPFFMENFLGGLLGYKFEEDWVFEDPDYTSEGEGKKKVEFMVLDPNDPEKTSLIFEIKGQKTQDLDKPQANHPKKWTPVQQARNYANRSGAEWYVVFNYNELRIYNKNEHRFRGTEDKVITFKIDELTEDDVKIILLLLSKTFFKDKGILDEIKGKTLMIENEITDDLYNLYHETRLMLVREITEGNEIEIEEAIKYAQIIMDRVIFTCFVEDRGLLPANIFEKTILEPIEKHTPKLRFDKDEKQVDRNLLWTNLTYLFQDINEGASLRKITKYNGKIFEDDLNFIKIRDLTVKKDEFSDLKQKHGITSKDVDKNLKDYNSEKSGFIHPIYRNFLLIASQDFNTEISVNVLGHIFEQSLTDLEEIKGSLTVEEKKVVYADVNIPYWSNFFTPIFNNFCRTWKISVKLSYHTK